jgi:hypothetical protein
VYGAQDTSHKSPFYPPPSLPQLPSCSLVPSFNIPPPYSYFPICKPFPSLFSVLHPFFSYSIASFFTSFSSSTFSNIPFLTSSFRLVAASRHNSDILSCERLPAHSLVSSITQAAAAIVFITILPPLFSFPHIFSLTSCQFSRHPVFFSKLQVALTLAVVPRSPKSQIARFCKAQQLRLSSPVFSFLLLPHSTRPRTFLVPPFHRHKRIRRPCDTAACSPVLFADSLGKTTCSQVPLSRTRQRSGSPSRAHSLLPGRGQEAS